MDESAGPSYIDQLQEFNRRTGKNFVDPTRIQGFGGEGDPPPPPLPPDTKPVHIPTAEELFGGPGVEVPEDKPEPAPIPPQIVAGSDELVVVEKAASYKSRGVILNDEERAGIITIVLKALRRDLDSQFLEVAGSVPRRRHTLKPEEPKRRGRPPKEKSNATV